MDKIYKKEVRTKDLGYEGLKAYHLSYQLGMYVFEIFKSLKFILSNCYRLCFDFAQHDLANDVMLSEVEARVSHSIFY